MKFYWRMFLRKNFKNCMRSQNFILDKIILDTC